MTTVVVNGNTLYSDTKLTVDEDGQSDTGKLFSLLINDANYKPVIKSYLYSDMVNGVNFNTSHGKWFTYNGNAKIQDDVIKVVAYSGDVLIIPLLKNIMEQQPEQWLSLYKMFYDRYMTRTETCTLCIVGEQYNYIVTDIRGYMHVYRYNKSETIGIGSGIDTLRLGYYPEHIIGDVDPIQYITEASLRDSYTNDIIMSETC